MRFLSRLRKRSKSRSRAGRNGSSFDLRIDSHDPLPPLPPSGPDCTKKLPPPVLRRIFAAVCPHAVDTSYDTSEESMTDDGCMLCDMRDLAHCALACKRWFPEARELLYSHVRIDPVHYCELEVELAAKRKRRSFFDRNGDPIDAPQVRLNLFMRSVRLSQGLGNLVLSLRMPYMTREASKADIARTVSVLPNLRYVDLPAGIYSDDQSCLALKQELMARCPDIRRMSYRHGAEGTFSQIPSSHLWVNLEVLELSGLHIEPNTLRFGLGSFPRLRDLTLSDLPWLDDPSLAPSQSLPPFPAVQRLTLRDTPNVTASGLAGYFSHSSHRNALVSLTLSATGVHPATLHRILAATPRLRALLVVQEVTRSFPADKVPPLASRSLELFHYEITSASGSYGLPPVAPSYYTYLVSSLVSNTLPALRDLYVRDSNFPETLLLAPPPRLFGGGESGPQLGGVLTQPLNVYSKGLDELEWNFTPYEPPATRGRRDSTTRPVSLHDAQLGRSWGGDARKSVLVGNGFGGFLAVPVENERPRSSGGWRRESRQDLWRTSATNTSTVPSPLNTPIPPALCTNPDLVDDCWSIKTHRDPDTKRIIPDPAKFPDGISGVASQIHDLGLKVGIYSNLKYDNCGVPQNWTDTYTYCLPDASNGATTYPNGTCPGLTNPAPPGYDWSQSRTAQRYRAMRDALLRVNRTILYSLCDWGQADWTRIAEIANENSFMMNHAGFWGYPDPDMLEVGNGNLTLAENRAHFALWAAMKAPLIIGTPLDSIDEEHLAVLKNKYLLDFHQDPRVGRPAYPYKWGYNADWTFDPAHPAEYWSGPSATLKGTLVLMLNSEGATRTRTAVWKEIPELQGRRAGGYRVTDAWTGEDMGCVSEKLSVKLRSHDVAALVVGDAC
ncbi:hypothetical protein BDV59DRAFT_193956 [Aspergillus ambiguus]|uniref:F-box domain protein n=1 Tax=Aspergillus ambiguus TaxID=176160 RepID=UPI003CCE0A6D